MGSTPTPHNNCKRQALLFPILQMGKLRHRMTEWITPSYTAGKAQIIVCKTRSLVIVRVYIPHPYNKHKGLDPYCLFYAHFTCFVERKGRKEREKKKEGEGEKKRRKRGKQERCQNCASLLTLLCITCNEVRFKDF